MQNSGRLLTFSGKVESISSDSFGSRTASDRKVYSYDLVNYPKLSSGEYLFCRVRACSADQPNANGDSFPYDELKNAYTSFIGKGVFIDHDTDSVEKIKGIILDAAFKEDPREGAWVELFLGVHRENEDLVRKIESGQITDVSMGCLVQAGTCSICGNVWRGETDDQGYPSNNCEHVPHYKASAWKDGRKVYEDCHDVEFVEISFVTNGADRQAVILDNKISPVKDIPENIAHLVDQTRSNKKVANTQVVENMLVRYANDQISTALFNLCEMINPEQPWINFQRIQSMSISEAKEKLYRKIQKVASHYSDNTKINTQKRDIQAKSFKSLKDLKVGDSVKITDKDYGYEGVVGIVYSVYSNDYNSDMAEIFIEDVEYRGFYQAHQKDIENGVVVIEN